MTILTVALSLSALVLVVLTVRPLRRRLISTWVMRLLAGHLPVIGDTERVALDAGTVWWDGELFSGNPDWTRLLSIPAPHLSPREKDFLDGPVEELCQMLDDWELRQQGDLPPQVWHFLKAHRFFGLIIPEHHEGLEMSALAHSAIITKIASRSVAAAVTVMVPNSLGPAELLLHYGTRYQKAHYLPRLARGEEIPCFALTEPDAGSDAAATQSIGVLCRGMFEEREVLGIRLNWRKRYITLGPVATLLGLAFRLVDPDGVYSEKKDLGITCALIPTQLPGVTIGERHDPMGVPFQNGPNEGHDVFIPADFIIGGIAMAGQGWRMLMECLAAGRSISLPALSVAGMELSTRVVSAYSLVRRQFDLPIEKFEGIEEPLARIGGLTYMMNAARIMTAGAVTQGERPAVLSAIVKAYLTEAMRQVVCDAMDIRAGAGICRGPRNLLEQMYTALPIAITVEGANILTRSMIIYGQGSIRCHPFVGKELAAIADDDLAAFDRAFFGHVRFIIGNAARAFAHAVTGSVFSSLGRLKASPVNRYLRRISRLSAAFAVVSDASMAALGGSLKQHEKISGRLADALAWMYLASAALKRFLDEGRQPEHLAYVRWSCEHALFLAQEALAGVLRNFPIPFVGRTLSLLLFPFGRRFKPPSDALGAQLARGLSENRQTRVSLTSDIFTPASGEPGLGRLEMALDLAVAALPVEKKIHSAIHSGLLPKGRLSELLDQALSGEIITAEEHNLVLAADELREEVIQVDAFNPARYTTLKRSPTQGPHLSSIGP